MKGSAARITVVGLWPEICHRTLVPVATVVLHLVRRPRCLERPSGVWTGGRAFERPRPARPKALLGDAVEERMLFDEFLPRIHFFLLLLVLHRRSHWFKGRTWKKAKHLLRSVGMSRFVESSISHLTSGCNAMRSHGVTPPKPSL